MTAGLRFDFTFDLQKSILKGNSKGLGEKKIDLMRWDV